MHSGCYLDGCDTSGEQGWAGSPRLFLRGSCFTFMMWREGGCTNKQAWVVSYGQHG